ncbi:hypothetical protein LWI28_028432 [Acer negundo]|uniref:Uncharacterized protein n=1 Tax=Acer negundo TaxID=4023 RepID=A0AAD5JKL1_ACENE|nr:hypothetical protein LWI28_028432 [Acer negundo]
MAAALGLLMEECVIHSPADHGLITRSPMKGDCMFLICIFTLKNPKILLHPRNPERPIQRISLYSVESILTSQPTLVLPTLRSAAPQQQAPAQGVLGQLPCRKCETPCGIPTKEWLRSFSGFDCSEWKRGFMIRVFLIIYCDNSNEAAYDTVNKSSFSWFVG